MKTWLTTKDVAKALGVTDSRVRQLALEESLIGRKVGRDWCFWSSQISKYVFSEWVDRAPASMKVSTLKKVYSRVSEITGIEFTILGEFVGEDPDGRLWLTIETEFGERMISCQGHNVQAGDFIDAAW